MMKSRTDRTSGRDNEMRHEEAFNGFSLLSSLGVTGDDVCEREREFMGDYLGGCVLYIGGEGGRLRRQCFGPTLLTQPYYCYCYDT